ncbi:micronuclear linker histone polyprotein-like [Haliotis cracherodii]|uniref:micronuclear linker histone polyprotein-like n=1 Tax=Haliotis cracherodii TaxID=6455 RepID=UPI0039E847C2
MKFSSEESHSPFSSKSGSAMDGKRPKILVNNFMTDNSPGRQRTKSVLFSADEQNDNLLDKYIDNSAASQCPVDNNRRRSKGTVSNGSRSTYRKGSDSVSSEKKDNFRSSTPKSLSSSRNSVSSSRRISVKSEDPKSSSRASVQRSESMSSDSTEESNSLNLSTNSNSIASAWEVFGDHVKNVHETSDYVCRKSRVSFQASDTFQKTMKDLFGMPVYGMEPEVPKFKSKVGNLGSVASRLIATTRRRRKATSEEEKRLALEAAKPSKTVVENARRGWRIIRRHVNETIAEKKGSSAAFNWSMLTQTVRGLTDMQRARIDLYKRYGIIPTVQPDGTTAHVNTMLSERARAASANSSTPSTTPPIRPKAKNLVSKQATHSRRIENHLRRPRVS